MHKHPISTRHPRWCDLQQCITGDDGARHTSTATRLHTGEQTFELTLVQHDPDGAPDLLMEVTTPPRRTAFTCSPCPRSRH